MLTLKPSFALFIGVLSVLMLGLFGGSVVKGQYSKVYSTYVGPPPANTGTTAGPGGTAGTLGSTGAVGTASVANTGNINDADLTNFATLAAQSGANGSGLLGGDGGTSSAYINLNFAGATTPINGTPIIIKLTASILGSVTVQAYNSGVAVGTPQAVSAMPTSSTDEYVFLAQGNCNSIRITSTTLKGTALGGGVSINNTNVFYAYIFDPTCNPPNYTATSKTQILDLGSGFVNPTNAIDGDIATFSKFSVGLGVGTTLYQDVYFSKLSNPGDAATITLAIPPSALSAGVLSYLNLNVYNGTTLVSNTSFGGLLLGTDLLTLLNAGLPITASIVPSGQFNRIQVSMSSLVGLATSLNLYEVQVTPPAPTFNPPVTLPAGFTLTICSGSSATITADAPGTSNELRWYDAPTGGNLKFTGNPYVTGALTANLKLYVATAKSGCAAESERIPVTVIVNSVTAGTIGSDQTSCSGIAPTPFTSTSAATGAGTITYQWQKSTDNITFTNITGATNLTYSEAALLTQTTYYQRIATSTLNSVACTATSNKITATVNAVTTGTIGSDQTLCSSTVPAAFTNTAATGAGTITYQWQKSTDNITFSNITGATNAAYSETAALTQTTYYQRIATSTLNSVGCSATSNKITLTVNNITAGTIGSNQVLCSGTIPVSFTNTAATGAGTITYQWQKSTDNITFSNITGAITATYSEIAALTQTTYYQRVATSSLNSITCTAISNKIIMTVNLPPTVSSIVGPSSLCPGTAYTFTNASLDPGTWSSDDPTIASVNSATGFVTGIAVGSTSIRYKITNAATGCSSIASKSVTVYALPSISLATIPAICLGTTTTSLPYTAVSSGSLKYDINWDTPGFVNVSNADLPTSPITLNIPATASAGTHTGTLIIKNTATSCTFSQLITVSINPLPTITITSDASVCKDITTAELLYTATSAPTSYNITWKTAASADGFINVPDTALPLSPINIIVPTTATVKTYTGTIIVKNANGCISSPVDFNVVVHPKPNPPQINIQ